MYVQRILRCGGIFSIGLLLATACSSAAPTPTAAPAAKPTAASAAAPAAQSTTAPAAAPAATQPAEAKPAATAGTVSCAEHASPGSSGAAIKMGADGSLTGATANFGLGMKRGIEICLKEFNDAGGYQGRKVEIPFLDDQAKPDVAVTNVTRFLEQDKVIAVLGPVNTGNALAFIPKTDDAEVPVIIPIATGVPLVYVDKDNKPAPLYGVEGVKPRKWVFRTSMQDNFQMETILNYAKASGWDAIGFMNDSTGYGTAGKDTATPIITAGGFKIISYETYNVGDTDMTSQLQKLKDAGVKQIVNFGLGPENANILRSAQKIGYKVQLSGAWGISDPVVPQLAGKELAEGTITVASFTVDSSPAAADFHKKMLRDYQEDPFPITAAQAYDATKMLFQALKTAGPDSTKLRDAIENLDGFHGVTASPAHPYSPTKHHTVETKDMFAAVYKDGVLVKAP